MSNLLFPYLRMIVNCKGEIEKRLTRKEEIEQCIVEKPVNSSSRGFSIFHIKYPNGFGQIAQNSNRQIMF